MSSNSYPDEETISTLLSFAVSIADCARPIALRYYRKFMQPSEKMDGTYITLADQKIELTAKSMVEEKFPEHGFWGEEYGASNLDRDWVWCIDPIDGTTAFVHGIPTFGILISLLYKKVPVIGIIDHPALGDRWVGAKHHRTTWQEQVCSSNLNQQLEFSIVFATSPDMFDADELRAFYAVTEKAKRRRYGIDCYAYGLLAIGKADVVMEANMKPHDIMALVPVVESAKGIITDWQGNPLTLDCNGQVLASANPELHNECLQIIEASL